MPFLMRLIDASTILNAIELLASSGQDVPQLEVPVDHLITQEFPVVESYIKKAPGKAKWCVHSHKGKKLGCYPSRAQAVKRLRQIEFFKHKGGLALPLAVLGAYIRRRKNFYNVYDNHNNFIMSYPDRASAESHKNEIERADWFKRTKEWIKDKREAAAGAEVSLEDALEAVTDWEKTIEELEGSLPKTVGGMQVSALAGEEKPKDEALSPADKDDVGMTDPILPKPQFVGPKEPAQLDGPGRDVILKVVVVNDSENPEGMGKAYQSDQVETKQFDDAMFQIEDRTQRPGEWYMSQSLKPRGWVKKADDEQKTDPFAGLSPEEIASLKKDRQETIDFATKVNTQPVAAIIDALKENYPGKTTLYESDIANAIDYINQRIQNYNNLFLEDGPDVVELSKQTVTPQVIEALKNQNINVDVLPAGLSEEKKEQGHTTPQHKETTYIPIDLVMTELNSRAPFNTVETIPKSLIINTIKKIRPGTTEEDITEAVAQIQETLADLYQITTDEAGKPGLKQTVKETAEAVGESNVDPAMQTAIETIMQSQQEGVPLMFQDVDALLKKMDLTPLQKIDIKVSLMNKGVLGLPKKEDGQPEIPIDEKLLADGINTYRTVTKSIEEVKNITKNELYPAIRELDTAFDALEKGYSENEQIHQDVSPAIALEMNQRYRKAFKEIKPMLGAYRALLLKMLALRDRLKSYAKSLTQIHPSIEMGTSSSFKAWARSFKKAPVDPAAKQLADIVKEIGNYMKNIFEPEIAKYAKQFRFLSKSIVDAQQEVFDYVAAWRKQKKVKSSWIASAGQKQQIIEDPEGEQRMLAYEDAITQSFGADAWKRFQELKKQFMEDEEYSAEDAMVAAYKKVENEGLKSGLETKEQVVEEEGIITPKTSQEAYEYAVNTLGARWEPGEALIAEDPEYAYNYAHDILKGMRVPTIEAGIALDPEIAYRYATDMLGGPFKEGEESIAGNPKAAYLYAKNILKNRFADGEAAIASEPKLAYLYAENVLQKRFPAGEPTIAADDVYREKYNKLFPKSNLTAPGATLPAAEVGKEKSKESENLEEETDPTKVISPKEMEALKAGTMTPADMAKILKRPGISINVIYKLRDMLVPQYAWLKEWDIPEGVMEINHRNDLPEYRKNEKIDDLAQKRLLAADIDPAERSFLEQLVAKIHTAYDAELAKFNEEKAAARTKLQPLTDAYRNILETLTPGRVKELQKQKMTPGADAWSEKLTGDQSPKKHQGYEAIPQKYEGMFPAGYEISEASTPSGSVFDTAKRLLDDPGTKPEDKDKLYNKIQELLDSPDLTDREDRILNKILDYMSKKVSGTIKEFADYIALSKPKNIDVVRAKETILPVLEKQPDFGPNNQVVTERLLNEAIQMFEGSGFKILNPELLTWDSVKNKVPKVPQEITQPTQVL